MEKYVIIHIPHSSMYIPDDYRKKALLGEIELESENKFMCDLDVDLLLNSKKQAIIFPYSRLYCDVERFKDDSEVMNKYGMGYIYTKTSLGEEMFNPSSKDRKRITEIYDEHHKLVDNKVSEILKKYNKCIIIDLHSYSDDLVKRLFNYEDNPDICIGVEDNYYSEEIKDNLIKHFINNNYSVKVNFPYRGSFIPDKFYGKIDTGIVSIMIEINRRVYLNDFDNFKKVLNEALDNIK